VLDFISFLVTIQLQDTKPFGREPVDPELAAEGLKAERALRLQNYPFDTFFDELFFLQCLPPRPLPSSGIRKLA